MHGYKIIRALYSYGYGLQITRIKEYNVKNMLCIFFAFRFVPPYGGGMGV